MRNNFDNDSIIKVGNTIRVLRQSPFIYRIIKGCFFSVILLIISFVIAQLVVIRIPAGKIGVRTHNFGLLGKKGVVDKDFTPGFHRKIYPFDSWNIFDATAQTLELSRQQYFEANKSAILFKLSSRNVKAKESGQQVRLTTSGGYNVDIDVTAKYKITEGGANKILREMGKQEQYKQIVKNIVLDICRQIFGEMTTEDFYNPDLKRQRIGEAEKLLRVELSKRHVNLVDLLIRDVAFDPNYETKIREKKLADQDIILNRSIAAAVLQKGVTDKIHAETEAMVKIKFQEKDATKAEIDARTNEEIAKINADYMKYVTEKQADANLYSAQKEANGSLLIKKSEAEGERLFNKALARKGGSRLVALEAARNIRLKDFILSSQQLNPINLDDIYKMLNPSPEK